MHERTDRVNLRCYTTLIALAIALLSLAACSQAPRSAVAVPARIEVRAGEFHFTPSDVVAKVGQPITIAYTNDGAIEHDWAVNDLLAMDVDVQMTTEVAHPEGPHAHATALPDVHIAAMPGQSGELVFTPEQAGRYAIICTITGHTEAGMAGTLTVIE
jgi:uncharacterized cupredoxin-like copper-binding protein